MNLETLLLAIAGAPALPGAKCRGRHHLFDDADQGEPPEVVAQRHQQALGLCKICPALASCAMWFDTLPASKRPPGVVAGRIHHGRPVRPLNPSRLLDVINHSEG